MEHTWKDTLVSMCQDMVHIPSHSGQEEKVAQYIGKTMAELGYDTVETDSYGNVSGRILLGKGGRTILLEGHMDHVGVSDPSQWAYDPFGAEIHEGRIYGRGTSDMKGNLAAAILAGSLVKELKGGEINGEVIVAGSVHEECFEGVASEAIFQRWRPDCVVIGEASSLNLKRGQRGRAEVVLETFGAPAHSSNPEVGVNAVKKMIPLLAAIEERFSPSEQEVLGKGILELTDIISSPYPGASVVPERCRVTYDRRLLEGETEEQVLGQIQRILDDVQKRDGKIKASVSLAVGTEKCYTGKEISAKRFAPGWLFPEDNWFVQSAMAGLRKSGLTPELSQYAFCTNGSYYAGKAGVPTIGFGGSLESLAHVVNEYIEIDQLEKACSGYMGIIGMTLSMP